MPMYGKQMMGGGDMMAKKEAKMQALQEIMQMLGDLEAEPFMPKDIKAVKVDIMAKKPMGEMVEMPESGSEMPEEENGIEAEVKGQNIEELKKKLAMLLK